MKKISRQKRRKIKKIKLLRRVPTKIDLPPDVNQFQAEKAIVVVKNVFVKASSSRCFDIITRQLEAGEQWDPMISRAEPLTEFRNKTGAMSKIEMYVAGKELDSRALVTYYKANKSLSWVLVDHPKVKEFWRLEPDKDGVTVYLTFGYENRGLFFLRLFKNLFLKRRRKVEEKVVYTLNQLKRIAETEA
jgi:hypothetical protein